MSATPYRPDLDGLRAVAVLAVVLYHAGVPGVSGGFVPAGPEVPELRTRYGTTFAGATPGTYD